MAENLFGRVPVGGITPSKFDPDFSDIFTEEQLQLDRDIFERQKFTQDRTLKLAAAEKVAGFDLSKIHNDFALDFKHQSNNFQKDFDGGQMTPEDIASEALRLSSLYNEYSGFYTEQRGLISRALESPEALAALNASLPAGSTYFTKETLAQMDAKAGMFFKEGTYNPQTNEGTFVLDDGTEFIGTLEQAFRMQATHGDIGSINNIGPYMLAKTDVELGSLYDEAIADKQSIAVRSDNFEWSEATAGEVFDARFASDKLFRGIVREDKGNLLNLTDEEKIAFDNQTYMLDPDDSGPSQFDVTKFDAIIARAREQYISDSKFFKAKEKATATDREYYRDEADKRNKQGSYLNSIKSQVTEFQEPSPASGFAGFLGLSTEPGETRTVVEAVNVPVPKNIVQTIKGIGSANITGLTITPDKRFYVTGYDSNNADLSREIDGGEVASILQKINEYFAFGANDMLSLEKILNKANEGGYDTLPFRGLNLDVIDPVEGEGPVEGEQKNKIVDDPLDLDL